jgi:hypothetical protein
MYPIQGNSVLTYSCIAYLFPSVDAPKYLKGFGVISGMCFFGIGVYLTAHVVVHRFAKRNNGATTNV